MLGVFGVIIQCVNRLVGKHSNQAHKDALDIYVSEVFQSDSESLYKIIVDQATELIDWLDRIDVSLLFFSPFMLGCRSIPTQIDWLLTCFSFPWGLQTSRPLTCFFQLPH